MMAAPKRERDYWKDLYYNNKWGYGAKRDVARQSHAGKGKDGVGLGLQYRPNRWWSKCIPFYGPNVVRC